MKGPKIFLKKKKKKAKKAQGRCKMLSENEKEKSVSIIAIEIKIFLKKKNKKRLNMRNYQFAHEKNFLRFYQVVWKLRIPKINFKISKMF